MSPQISWSSIDINQGTKGYLDSTEVVNAKKQGITNVFVGMIEEEYENPLDADKIRDKYDRGAFGKIPMYGSVENRNRLIQLYRELVITKCRYENLKEDFDEKYGIKDAAKNWLSKNLGIFKENKEYTSAKTKLTELSYEIMLKEKELQDFVTSAFYETYNQSPRSESVAMMITVPAVQNRDY